MGKLIKLAIVIFVGQFFYFGFLVSPNTDLTSSNLVSLQITPGESLKNIAAKLKTNNVINSKFLFLSYAKYKKQTTTIQSGTFTIPLPQTIPSTLELLQRAPLQEDKITVPEGFKISQIDNLLATKNLILPGEFINCVQHCDLNHPILNHIPKQEIRNLEGFLFPDTYFINPNSFSSQELILKMLNNFQKKLPANYQSQMQNLPLSDLYNVINMASIIEREVLSLKDKKLVSGILWKRYRSNWLIDADAALLYQKDNNIITRADLDSNSPYNIRKFPGLPPTPISNPGLASIEASLDPTESQFWFYLTTLDTGEVIYAQTNDDHNANKFKYLR